VQKNLHKLLEQSKPGHKCMLSERSMSRDNHSQKSSLTKSRTISNQIGLLNNMFVKQLCSSGTSGIGRRGYSISGSFQWLHGLSAAGQGMKFSSLSAEPQDLWTGIKWFHHSTF